MRYSSRADEDKSIGSVVLFDILLEIRLLDAENVFARSENCSAKSLALESSSVQMIKDDLLQLLVNFFTFS
jgi:hypothetical protein